MSDDKAKELFDLLKKNGVAVSEVTRLGKQRFSVKTFDGVQDTEGTRDEILARFGLCGRRLG